jgi:hypothetical protein
LAIKQARLPPLPPLFHRRKWSKLLSINRW